MECLKVLNRLVRCEGFRARITAKQGDYEQEDVVAYYCTYSTSCKSNNKTSKNFAGSHLPRKYLIENVLCDPDE